jgi:hypothetical protein
MMVGSAGEVVVCNVAGQIAHTHLCFDVHDPTRCNNDWLQNASIHTISKFNGSKFEHNRTFTSAKNNKNGIYML